jgi:hypothetical protein
VDLLGRAEELPEAVMRSFARFAMTIRYPPNPNQRLDRRMNSEQQAGFDFFTGPFLSGSGLQNCAACHKLPIGTNRLVNFENTQVGRDMKTAHLRNIYEKVGRFNTPGPQVSGFGLLHDGSVDTVVNFLRLDTFVFPGKTEKEKDTTRHSLQSYLLAFDTGMAPAVGRQLTVTRELQSEDRHLLGVLIGRSALGDCDLTAKGWEESALRGWLYRGDRFYGDRRGEPPLALQLLLNRYRRSEEPLTFTCVPPGDGLRTALDRDLDGYWDGDELSSGSDPAEPASVPFRTSRQ